MIAWADLRFEKDDDGERVELGRGAYGSVYAADYSFMRVAVKVLALGGASGPALVAALRREAALQASIAHEHIVRVYGLAEGAAGKFGLVMARMHSDLQSRIAAAAASGAPEEALPWSWRLGALQQLASGLAHLHAQRVVHGDIK